MLDRLFTRLRKYIARGIDVIDAPAGAAQFLLPSESDVMRDDRDDRDSSDSSDSFSE